MKTKFIRDELQMIADRYPTLQGILKKTLGDGHKQVGKVWIETIQARNLDADHFSNVCYAYAMAEKRLPEPIDQLVFEIIQEVRDLMDKDQRKLEQYEKYHRSTSVMQWVKDDRTGSIAVWLGEQVKRGHITKEENDRRMDELLAWDKQPEVLDKPAWIGQEVAA